MGIFDSFKQIFTSTPAPTDASKPLKVLPEPMLGKKPVPEPVAPRAANPQKSPDDAFLDRLDTAFKAEGAEHFVNFANDALRKANRATRIRTRESYVALAEQKLRDVRGYLGTTKGVSLTNLEAFEKSIAAVRAETETMKVAQADQIAADEALLTMPLDEQCKVLGIDLEVIELDKTPEGWMVDETAYKKPEQAAFAYFKSEGYTGAYCEGTAPLSLLKCACMDYLKLNEPQGDATRVYRSYFEGQCEIHSEKSHEIIEQIRVATDEVVQANLKLLLKAVKGFYPEMDSRGMTAIWKAMGNETAVKIAEIFMQDPYGFRAGWPDLTLAKRGELRFIEVKTSDKIHASQRDTIRELLLPIGEKVSVVKLKAKRKKA